MTAELAFYKTLFIVPDLQAAARRFNALGDYDWREVPAAPQMFRMGTEVREFTIRAIISGTTPRIHLIEEVRGTPWAAAEGGAAHHVAYWVDDLAAAHRRLLAMGFTVEACDVNASGEPQVWAYFIAPDGVRIELLDSNAIPGQDAFVTALPPFVME